MALITDAVAGKGIKDRADDCGRARHSASFARALAAQRIRGARNFGEFDVKRR